MDYETVVRVIREELGDDPERLFNDFDVEPIAAASIGQVHRARLNDGTEVVVKVQYPGVDEAISADLSNMGMMFMLMGAALPHVDAAPLAEELKGRMLDELDYVKEADNQERFAELFADQRRILIPRVFRAFSSRRVLTSEYVEGQDLYSFTERCTPEQRHEAVLAVYRFAYDSIWLHCCFNSDPHPGNYLFLEDGRVAFLDFGSVKDFDPKWTSDFNTLIGLYLRGDKDGYYEQARDMGIIVKGHEHRVDKDWLWDWAQWFHIPVLEDRQPFHFTHEYCKQAVQQVTGENMTKVNMPAEYLMMNRLTFGLNSILSKLGAKENFRLLSWHYFFDDGPAPPADW